MSGTIFAQYGELKSDFERIASFQLIFYHIVNI